MQTVRAAPARIFQLCRELRVQHPRSHDGLPYKGARLDTVLVLVSTRRIEQPPEGIPRLLDVAPFLIRDGVLDLVRQRHVVASAFKLLRR